MLLPEITPVTSSSDGATCLTEVICTTALPGYCMGAPIIGAPVIGAIAIPVDAPRSRELSTYWLPTP